MMRARGTRTGVFPDIGLSIAHLLFLTVSGVLAISCGGTALRTLPRPASSDRSLAPTPDLRLSKDEIVSDVRELVRLLETSHPDPYTRGGGRVAFHRRVYGILDSIPQTGLTVRQFLRRLRPLVASVRDGHTWIEIPGQQETSRRTSVELDVVGERIYVSGVFREQDRPALGQRVAAVEGVPWNELVERVAAFRGSDNRYNNLEHLIDAIQEPEVLEDLLERGDQLVEVRIELESVAGAKSAFSFPVKSSAAGAAIRPPSRVPLPIPNAADLAWGFLTDDRSVAILRIESMMRYREAFEAWRSRGHADRFSNDLNEVVQRATGRTPPSGLDARIALVPSATETFRDLFSQMNKARTSTLLVDLRNNRGGNSLIDMILGCFLYPVDRLMETDWGYQIPRFSKLYFENYKTASLQRFREEGWDLLDEGDLDFSGEKAWREEKASGRDEVARESGQKDLTNDAAMDSSNELCHDQKENATWSGKVIVLTSARTYSAGFDLAAMLVKHGAKVVGVPSGQSGNCFIDTLSFCLPHSGLIGGISYKLSLKFPDEPAKGEVLHPDLEMSYEDLAAKNFDPNASVLFALEMVKRERLEQ